MIAAQRTAELAGSAELAARCRDLEAQLALAPGPPGSPSAEVQALRKKVLQVEEEKVPAGRGKRPDPQNGRAARTQGVAAPGKLRLEPAR